MELNVSGTHEVIMAGLGGKGVLTIGQVLATAALPEYNYVSYFPSYGGAMRGDACECTIILAQNEIDCPMLTIADTVVVVEPSQLESFEARVVAGGKLIIESSGLKHTVERNDLDVIKVPAVEIALGIGDVLVANFVLLGVYVANTGALPAELVEEEIEKKYHHNKRQLQLNREAFRHGIKRGQDISAHEL